MHVERPDLADLAVAALDELRRHVGGGLVELDLRGAAPVLPAPEVLRGLAELPLVVVAVTDAGAGVPAALADAVDVVVSDEEDREAVTGVVADAPLAATALALLLRGATSRSAAEGVAAESATYSALQAGPEHRRWLAARPAPRRRAEPDEPVALQRDGDVLRLELRRPHVRNAFDARTREALLDRLAVAAADPGITAVELRGAGAAFCSGGDLDEFGTLDDPASAHLVRVARSVGLALDGLAVPTTAFVHGACVGAGVELPAFVRRVVAHPATTFRLPEVAMGLVPGAGGTVGVPRRIGRHRTALLALTGAALDAPTALAWGLVDELDDAVGRSS